MPVFSDECYVEFTWEGRGRSILEHGLDGVVAVHSLSKRSNLAGGRIGFYAGDPDLVHYLQEVRKHVGMMVPGPAQAAGVVALDDDAHVGVQRDRYRRRLARMAEVLGAWTGETIPLPAGGFYLWFPVDDDWAFTERLAAEGGAIVAPGEFYGAPGPRARRRGAARRSDRAGGVAVGGVTVRRTGVQVAGVVLIVAGVVVGALLWLAAGRRYDDAVADLAPVPLGCTTTLVVRPHRDVHVLRRDEGRDRRDRRRLRHRRPGLRRRRRRRAPGGSRAGRRAAVTRSTSTAPTARRTTGPGDGASACAPPRSTSPATTS